MRIGRLRPALPVSRALAVPAVLLILQACTSSQHAAAPPLTLDAPSAGRPLQDQDAPDEESKGFLSRFIDPEDGMFDLTAKSKGGSGFIPIVLPISDPAVGFGLLTGLAYFHPQPDSELNGSGGSNIPPSTTFGGGAYTQDGSWAAAIGHKGIWNDGHTRYVGVLGLGSINLDFYGIGDDAILGSQPLDFTLESTITQHELEFQLGNSDWFLGTSYTFASTETEFDDTDVVSDLERDSDNAGLGLILSFDSRDNTFTPNRGTRAESRITYFSEALGGNFDYPKLDLTGLWYRGVTPKTVLGLRLEGHWADDDAPFYALPFVTLRGVPAFRYLGRYVLIGELEARWKLTNRWSVVGFGGVGKAASSAHRLSEVDTVYSLGTGFRYLIARKLGIAMGIDVARGPEDTAVYFTVGSAWLGK